MILWVSSLGWAQIGSTLASAGITHVMRFPGYSAVAGWSKMTLLTSLEVSAGSQLSCVPSRLIQPTSYGEAWIHLLDSHGTKSYGKFQCAKVSQLLEGFFKDGRKNMLYIDKKR